METELILIALIIFLASFVQGFSGFGFALVSIPLLSLIINIKEAIPLGALCGLVVNVYLIFHLKAHIELKEVKNIIMGSLLGIPFGVFILSKLDPHIIKIALGALVLIFTFLSLTKLIRQRNLDQKWGYPVGFLSGLLGGAFNTNGPPVLIYFYIRGLDKFKFKGQITGFFIFTSSAIVVSHVIAGITTSKIFFNFVYLLPVILTGIITGTILFKRISSELFNKLVLIFLSFMGFYLIISSM